MSLSVIQLLRVGVLKTGWAAQHIFAPLAWKSHDTAWADTDICLSSLLIRRSVWNVRACSVSAACGQMCVAPKQPQHEATRNVTPWVGLCRYAYTYKGLRQQGVATWGLLVLIRSIGPVCKGFCNRMTIPHPNPILLPTCYARSLLNDHDSFIWDGFIVFSAAAIASSYV